MIFLPLHTDHLLALLKVLLPSFHQFAPLTLPPSVQIRVWEERRRRHPWGRSTRADRESWSISFRMMGAKLWGETHGRGEWGWSHSPGSEEGWIECPVKGRWDFKYDLGYSALLDHAVNDVRRRAKAHTRAAKMFWDHVYRANQFEGKDVSFRRPL